VIVTVAVVVIVIVVVAAPVIVAVRLRGNAPRGRYRRSPLPSVGTLIPGCTRRQWCGP
jgi:hypothetical protein